MPVDHLFEQIAALQDTIEGVTISGGEPLQQPQALLRLLERVRRETSLSMLVFSGFAWEDIQPMPLADPLLAAIDVLVAGRYLAEQRLARGLLGSANKTVHFLTPRYGPQDLQAVPPAEIIITPQGEVISSGIHPVKL
jgi:anaerobic ribonucleoside-triphosphate reductase activating protein